MEEPHFGTCNNVSVCVKKKVELSPEKVSLSVWKEQDKRSDTSPSLAAAGLAFVPCAEKQDDDKA